MKWLDIDYCRQWIKDKSQQGTRFLNPERGAPRAMVQEVRGVFGRGGGALGLRQEPDRVAGLTRNGAGRGNGQCNKGGGGCGEAEILGRTGMADVKFSTPPEPDGDFECTDLEALACTKGSCRAGSCPGDAKGRGERRCNSLYSLEVRNVRHHCICCET